MQLLCLGDIAIGDEYVTQQRWNPPNGIQPNEHTKVLFNWELPIGTIINSEPRSRGPRLLAYPGTPSVLEKWAPGYATLATNHILDAGVNGLINTLESLNSLGFETVGAGPDSWATVAPLFWETSEGKLAILNWVFAETHPDWNHVPGPNCWPGIEEAQRIIGEIKSIADWVLVVVHWSDEIFPYPRPEDRAIAHALAQMGVDLIIGHHPHVVRGIEIVDSCPVFYSLGNFYFSNYAGNNGVWIVRQAPRNREGLGVQITFRRGAHPECRTYSFWKLKNKVVADHFHQAEKRATYLSKTLYCLHGSEYASWYKNRRTKFFQQEYFWHFGIWKQGLRGLTRSLLRYSNKFIRS